MQNNNTIYDLVKSGKIDDAKKVWLKKLDNPSVLSLYIKILTEEENYKEAERFCLEYLDDSIICSQYLYILIGQNRYEEARKICEKYHNVKTLKAQYIRILNYFKEYELLEKIANNYPDDIYISKAFIYSLIDQQRYNEARTICNRFIYDNDIFRIYTKIKDKKEPVSSVDASRKYFKILEQINKGNDSVAKEMCSSFLEDRNIFDLYLMLIEKNRIEEQKKLCFKYK